MLTGHEFKTPLHVIQSLVLVALFLLPAISPPLFGWLNGFLAAPVLYLLLTRGAKAGFIQLQLIVFLAGVVALLAQRFEFFLFSLTLIPLGYSLYRSVAGEESAATSGLKGLVLLASSWLFFWSIYGALAGVNPYTTLLKSLDLGFQQALELYKTQESGLSEETLYSLQLIISTIRESIPSLLPGLLASIVLVTVWLNMVVCNSVVSRLLRVPQFWGEYSSWKLPEHLVWLPITATAGALVGWGDIKNGSIWLLMLSGLLYFFQGLAVCIALLDRWKTPQYIRAVLYLVLLFQSYGLLVLALLGLSDVWFNFRHLKKATVNNG